MRSMILSVTVAIPALLMPTVAPAETVPLSISNQIFDPALGEGEYLGGGTSCTIPRGGRGPKGANLFFENCWWFVRVCSRPGGRRVTQYRCQSCPDLVRPACPRGSTAWH
jgi:hypothetical protein